MSQLKNQLLEKQKESLQGNSGVKHTQAKLKLFHKKNVSKYSALSRHQSVTSQPQSNLGSVHIGHTKNKLNYLLHNDRRSKNISSANRFNNKSQKPNHYEMTTLGRVQAEKNNMNKFDSYRPRLTLIKHDKNSDKKRLTQTQSSKNLYFDHRRFSKQSDSSLSITSMKSSKKNIASPEYKQMDKNRHHPYFNKISLGKLNRPMESLKKFKKLDMLQSDLSIYPSPNYNYDKENSQLLNSRSNSYFNLNQSLRQGMKVHTGVQNMKKPFKMTQESRNISLERMSRESLNLDHSKNRLNNRVYTKQIKNTRSIKTAKLQEKLNSFYERIVKNIH